MSGLSAAQTSAYSSMICGMVSDGDFSHLLGLWTATTSFNNSLVNLANPGTNNLIAHVISTIQSPGWQGNGSSMYFDTVMTSGWTQNSGSFGICVLNNRVSTNPNLSDLGGFDGTEYWDIQPLSGSGVTVLDINGTTLPSPSISATVQGAYGVVRSASATINAYYNGVGIAGNPISSISAGNLTGRSNYILALDNNGSTNNYSSDTIGYAWIGDGSVNATNLYKRLHTFINDAAIGGSAC